MTAKEKSSGEIIADAQAEEVEAAALIESLEDRVRDGDDSVRPEELEKARGLWRFAQLRRTAAAKKAEQARHLERQNALEAGMAALTPRLIAPQDDLQPLVNQAHAALSQLVEAAISHNAAVERLSWLHNTYPEFTDTHLTSIGGSGSNNPIDPTVIIDDNYFVTIDIGAWVLGAVTPLVPRIKAAMPRHQGSSYIINQIR
jgi:hypothetical protein